ncbi:YceI family protein [Halomonas halodenitrificans]|uniref:YceI family protein n=1 Tax=Halomonas halodenitrificans TaxID=28252 RepID=UPI0004818273|nr:YceI family protein [Halomonas halodenitrificans]
MKVLLVSALLLATPAWAQAAWQLDEERSSVHYVSVKDASTGEINSFGTLSGTIDAQESRVVIDLASVETGIDIRNERMQEMLFETGEFGEAEVSVAMGEETLSDMQAGEHRQATQTLSLTLHGETLELEAEMQALRLDDSSLVISSVHPVIISAEDFGLGEGVEALREVAGLSSISTSVPVSFNLMFTK